MQYPWHALHGQTLDVERALSAEGERVYVITLADGSLTHLPVWMTEDAAAGPSTLVVSPHGVSLGSRRCGACYTPCLTRHRAW